MTLCNMFMPLATILTLAKISPQLPYFFGYKTEFFPSKTIQTRGPNGPNIAHLGILLQFGQTPSSGYCDIVIFMFCAILVTADGNNLAMPNCKKLK